MFTDGEKKMVIHALVQAKAGIERAKTKARQPEFGPIYDKELAMLASALVKVQSLEVKK